MIRTRQGAGGHRPQHRPGRATRSGRRWPPWLPCICPIPTPRFDYANGADANPFFDLWRANALFAAAGVPADRIEVAGIDTAQNTTDFSATAPNAAAAASQHGGVVEDLDRRFDGFGDRHGFSNSF